MVGNFVSVIVDGQDMAWIPFPLPKDVDGLTNIKRRPESPRPYPFIPGTIIAIIADEALISRCI